MARAKKVKTREAMAATLRNNKRKGQIWESAVAVWLQDQFGGAVERRRLQGVQDRGDLAGVPGLVIECKDEKQWNAGVWLKETDVETANEIAHTRRPAWGITFKRSLGHPSPSDGVVLMRPSTFAALWAGDHLKTPGGVTREQAEPVQGDEGTA